jgi:hypothetical protein
MSRSGFPGSFLAATPSPLQSRMSRSGFPGSFLAATPSPLQ